MTDSDELDAWIAQQLMVRAAAARRRAEDRRTLRAELAAARKAGKERRHARRLTSTRSTTPQPGGTA